MSKQTEFTFAGWKFVVDETGAVQIHSYTAFAIQLEVDEFKQLAQAQQNAVWASQHWTSLAQVSDALASLLAVYPRVWVERVGRESADEGKYYHYATLLVDGACKTVYSTADVQEVFRQLNEQPASTK